MLNLTISIQKYTFANGYYGNSKMAHCSIFGFYAIIMELLQILLEFNPLVCDNYLHYRRKINTHIALF